MDHTTLHIITPNVPNRYAYNGSADIYWKIIAFQKLGINCILHIINRPSAIPESIRALSAHIFFYERTKGHASISFETPVNVNRLYNKRLMSKLMEDEFPILFDSIETTSYLKSSIIASRLHFIYLHKTNTIHFKIAFKLKHSLSYILENITKSFFYVSHNKKVIQKAWVISDESPELAVKKYGILKNYEKMMPFIGIPISRNESGKGNYCMIHGDFSDSVTNVFTFWLLERIFQEMDIPFVVVGKNPSNQLEISAHKKLHTCLVADPTEKELIELISKSQLCIHLDHTDKFYNHAVIISLQHGRHVLKVSENQLQEESDVHEKLKNQIAQLFSKPFTEIDSSEREKELNELSQDELSAKRFKEIIDAHGL
jgi:hypothetical protein